MKKNIYGYAKARIMRAKRAVMVKDRHRDIKREGNEGIKEEEKR